MFEIILLILAVIFAIPVTTFTFEILLGVFNSKNSKVSPSTESISSVILVPAHNEEEVIEKTLESIKEQLNDNDEVVVVADNCSDKTAEIVRQFNFIALERTNLEDRGKGYALDFGIQYIIERNIEPDVVTIIDADCLLEPNALSELKRASQRRNAPVQSCYLMLRGEQDRLSIKISEFAFMVKNKIRLRGLSRLGCPVPLTGTGMTFPWETIKKAKLATGDIVEDMRLGVELVEQGKGPTYCDSARVYSYFPTSEKAEKTQNERWEHGHLSTITRFVPRLLKHSLFHFSYKSLGSALDLLVPPLSLLIILIFALASVGFFLSIFIDVGIAARILVSYLFVILLAVLIAWVFHGRKILAVKDFTYIPIYIASKIGLYLKFFYDKQTKWIRTDRK